MLEQIGGFIGMMAADVVHLFRGRQAVPCLVEWDQEPDGDPDVRDAFTKTSQTYYAAARGDRAAQARLAETIAIRYGESDNPAALPADPLRRSDEDCCPDYDIDCCLTTDTLGEYGK